MRFQQAPYRIADVVALLFIAHGNTSFGSLAPIIPYRSCKHYLAKEFVLITSNANHPAFDVDESNLHIIRQNGPSLKEALAELKSEYGCERITIQSGGTLNSLFLHEKLFDYIDIVIAPVLIGGKDTPTLIDGKSLLSESKLSKIGVLKLQECMVLKKSYLRLRYKVIH
jgi:2,5-diamino-6-(ribosylamino)-4(3H)-pyrimidinone 5'-phosphate reductase